MATHFIFFLLPAMNTVKEVVSVDAQEKQLNGTQSRIDRFTERLYDLQRLNREAKENSSKAMHIIHMINSSTSGVRQFSLLLNFFILFKI